MTDKKLFKKPKINIPDNTFPSTFQMLKNFSKELVNYVKEGAPNVTAIEYAERLDICNKCPHVKKASMRCGLCGRLLEQKAKWKTTTCPDNPERWKKLLTDEEKNETREKQIKKNKELHEQRQKNNNTNSSN